MSPRRYKPRRRDPSPPPGKPTRAVLLRLATYLPPLRWKLLAAAVCMIFATTFGLGIGPLAQRFLDAIPRGQESHSLRELNLLALLGAGMFFLKAALSYGQQYLMANAAQRLGMRLRNQVFEHLQSLSLSFFDTRKTGQLMASITNDVPALQNNFTSTILDSFSAPLTVVIGIGLLFYFSWQLTLVSMLILPAVAFLITIAGRRMRRYSADVQSSLADISEVAEETLSGVRAVKSFANEPYEVKRFQRRSSQAFRSIMRSTRMRAAIGPLIELSGAVGIIAVLWFGGWQVVYGGGGLTIGGLSAFVLTLQQIAQASRNLANINMSLAAACAAADRLFQLLDTESNVQEKPDAVVLPRGEGRVRFEGVSFAYRRELKVLEDITLEAAPGQVLALVGPTGAGKSSIAALIPRFYDVTEGRVTIDGYDVRDVTLTSLRGQIGIVPQETVLFAATVRENIAYGRLEATEEEIIEAAKAANAHNFIVALPEQYDTLIGERGVRLSGGERQRLSIARAILRNPRILILDEATSSLDTQSEALVQDALDRLMAERTTLVIAHRLSTVRHADLILVIDRGRIVERGTHEELLRLEGVYARLYRTQFRWEGGRPRIASGQPTGEAGSGIVR
ncbi:MAG: ABC transporter ATP-binding protein [Armatimonadetes bacterium]|nr:ABC transporter ATP-binding protein [Armatimonadota bacterium]